MDLLLIRHALPVRIDRSDGAADPELSDHGHRQAEALAAWLEPVDVVVSSPLRRAIQTAAPIDAAPQIVDGIAEFDRDADFYVPIEEMAADDFQAMIDRGVPQEFQDLVVASVDSIIDAHPGRSVAAVCHGGVINCYLAHMLGIDRRMFFEPSYTGITRIRAGRNGLRSLVSVNEVPHLREVGLTP